MRASIVWLMAVACGGAPRPQPQDKPAASDHPPTASPAVEPITAAVIASDHIKVLALTPTAITVKRDVKLPMAPDEARWLDHEHIVAVDAKGQAYLVTGDSVAVYRMPPAKSWSTKLGRGAKISGYPNKLTLARTTAGVELASCVSYFEGDDDPCETWMVTSLGTSLDVGKPVVGQQPEDEDPAEHDITPAPSDQPATEWKDDADGIHTKVVLRTGSAKREWEAPEPCPFTDARIKWLSEDPPIVAFVATTDCGEGGPVATEHLLTVPALTDFSPDGDTLVISSALWAHSTDDGWKLQTGARVVGPLDNRPILQPDGEPTLVAAAHLWLTS